MPALKLSKVASNLPNKWMRAITTTTTSTIVTTASATTLSTPNCTVGFSRRLPAGWRTTASAPLSFPAHIPCRHLGFRSQKIFFSSEDRGGEGLGGIVPDMGSENKCDQWPPEEKPLVSHKPYHQRQQPSPSPPEQHQQHSAKLLTLPTILTIGRVASVPVLVGTFHVDSWWGATATTGIFIAAAITDWLDGYIARKLRLSSAFGAFLDPVADKLMVAATLVLLCTRPLEIPMLGQVSWLLTVPVIVIIGREITMSAVREWAASQSSKVSEAVAVNNLGKWKTATQMTALTILLASRDSSLTGMGTLVASGVVLLYISAWLAVWSLVVYMRKIWKVLLK